METASSLMIELDHYLNRPELGREEWGRLESRRTNDRQGLKHREPYGKGLSQGATGIDLRGQMLTTTDFLRDPTAQPSFLGSKSSQGES